MAHPRSFAARMKRGMLGQRFRPGLERCKRSINDSYDYCCCGYSWCQSTSPRPSPPHQTFFHQIPSSKPQPRRRLSSRLLTPQGSGAEGAEWSLGWWWGGGQCWVVEDKHSSADHTLHSCPSHCDGAKESMQIPQSKLSQGKHVFLLQRR